MALNINGTTGISGVDGSVSAPALTGTDSNTGITFPAADTIKFSTGGVERMAITNSGVTGVSGGKILQVVHASSTADGSVNCNPTRTRVDIPNQNLTITPAATSSKILISFQQFGETGASAHQFSIVLKRAISGGATTEITGDKQSGASRSEVFTLLGNYAGGNGSDNNTTPEIAHCANYLDSPNTTSAVTYTLSIQNHESTGLYYYNRSLNDSDANENERGISWITAMEVGA